MLSLVCLRLLEALSCDYTDPARPTLTADPHILCWQGQHMYMAAASLISFSFFVPVSIMVAPMLMEAPAPAGAYARATVWPLCASALQRS